MQRNYIFVPFQEKDEVKKLGGKWDPSRKNWYYLGKRNRIFYKWENLTARNEIRRTEIFIKMLIIKDDVVQDVYIIICKIYIRINFSHLFLSLSNY